MTDSVVHAENLRKSYGKTVALDGMDLDIMQGEVFGIVGPNGAGKTTTIDCIAGMRHRDSGTLLTLGMDPSSQANSLHKRIGLQQQESQLPGRMKVIEALDLFSGLFGISPSSDELLEKVGLMQKRESYFSQLSGGQKRRLFVALAMVNRPELILLDELTSGLDPRGRRELWSLVEDARESGHTVVLSTHYMDEAQKLCNRVAIVHHGKVVALDTPEALIKRYCPGLTLRIGCDESFDPGSAKRLEGVLEAAMTGQECVMELSGAGYVVPVIQALSREGASLGDLHTVAPTLEDVFMVITGKEYGSFEE